MGVDETGTSLKLMYNKDFFIVLKDGHALVSSLRFFTRFCRY